MAVLRYICDLNTIEIRCFMYDRITTGVKTASYDLRMAVYDAVSYVVLTDQGSSVHSNLYF